MSQPDFYMVEITDKEWRGNLRGETVRVGAAAAQDLERLDIARIIGPVEEEERDTESSPRPRVSESPRHSSDADSQDEPHEVGAQWECGYCNQPFRTEHGKKIHEARIHGAKRNAVMTT